MTLLLIICESNDLFSDSLGSVCTSDSDCSTENANCYYLYNGCDKGLCSCDADYYQYSGTSCRLSK